MNTSIMVLTKKVINGFVRKGAILDSPAGELSLMNLPDESVRYLRAYVTLITSSSLLNRYGWIFVNSPVRSVADAMRYWNMQHPDEQINVKTGINSVDHTRVRLAALFGDSLETVLFRPEQVEYEKYWADLRKAMDLYCKQSVFKENISINVSSYISSEIPNEEDIKCFCEMIAPYRKTTEESMVTVLKIYRSVPEYINYLNKKPDKSEQELAIYLGMQRFLSGETEEFCLKQESNEEI